MNKNGINAMKTFSRKNIFITWIGLIALNGCNSGSSTSDKDLPQLNQRSTNSIKLDDGKVFHYQPLPYIELGDGFDPNTNSIRRGGDDTNKRLSLLASTIASNNNEATSVINKGNSSYEEFAKYSGSADNYGSAHRSEKEAAAGVSYGLYMASIKSASSNQSTQSGTKVEQYKVAGVVHKATASLRFDSGLTPSSIDRERTADALLNAIGGLKEALNKISNAKSSAARNLAIQSFYEQYGTHVVTSVTKGYVGYRVVKLTQTESTGETQSSYTRGAGFSSPWAKADYTASASNGSSYDKKNWAFQSYTYATPDDSELVSQIKKAYDEIDQQMAAMDIIDIKALKSPIDSSKLDFPTVKFDTTVNPDLIKEQKDKSTLKKKMNNDISELEQASDKLLELIQARDNESDASKEKLLNTTLKDYVAIESDYAILIKKFNDEYIELNLDSTQAAIVATARKLQREVSINIEIKANDLQDKLKNKASLEEAAKNADEKEQFTLWLKNKKFPAECDGSAVNECKSFEKWLDEENIETIISYKKEWKVYIELLHTTLNQTVTHLKTPLAKANFMRLSATNQGENDNTSPVTLDFNITPWAKLFSAQLLPTAIDNLSTLAQSKLIIRIREFVEDENYLQRVAQVYASSGLNNKVAKDLVLKNKFINLQKALSDSLFCSDDSNCSSEIVYDGKTYDMLQEQAILDLSQKLNQAQHSSELYKDESDPWTSAFKSLKKAGIIKPSGILLGFVANPTPNSKPATASQLTLLVNQPINDHGAIYFNNSNPNVGSSPGIQLGSSIEQLSQKNQLMISALVLISPQVNLNNNNYLGIDLLLSDGTLLSANNKTGLGLASFTESNFIQLDMGDKAYLLSTMTATTPQQYCAPISRPYNSNLVSRHNFACEANQSSWNKYSNLVLIPYSKALINSMIYQAGLDNLDKLNPLFKLYYSDHSAANSTLLQTFF